MLNSLYAQLNETAPVAVVIIAVSGMLLGGFLLSRVTKRLHLPNVTAYILAGILLGPYCLDLVPRTVVEGSAFLPDIALAFIAFSTGEYFRLDVLRRSGWRVVTLTLAESLLASVLVFGATYWALGLSLAFSIVLGALAAATAPASTIMTIRQTGAKGPFVDTLLQVVALDDIVGLVAYSVAISVAVSSLSGQAFAVRSILVPLGENLGALALGGLFGGLMKLLLTKNTTDNRLIIAIAMLFTFCGVCAAVDISPLLGCMAMGTVYINLTGDDRLFKQLNYFSPPILLLFFVRSGLSFDLGALVSASGTFGRHPLLVIGVIYFLVRIAGKYLGAFLGALGMEKSIRRYLGLALIPQAGVAIGLAALGARTLGGEAGNALQTIILASSVLYELIGPACGKLALYLSKSYSTRLEDVAQVPPLKADGTEPTPVEALIARINRIQAELPQRQIDENEQAFTQAAEEHFQNQFRRQRPFFRR
mgnify:CR=1 FL=1